MNRKNLTAAVLAGLAGVAGLAGTAQAVNLNPDGLGQVLIYPYYTANDGNTTILSVVNTTDNAKAVKVRFLEGFNSREVLDFNLYMSHHDVWVAAIAKGVSADAESYETDTFLIIPDDSCTVPYLYEDKQITLDDGSLAGMQPFLNLAYTGKKDDGGPQTDDRVGEGHFEIIEMGTIYPGNDTYDAITHVLHKPKDEPSYWAPGDCDELVDNWTDFGTKDGIWLEESKESKGGIGQAYTDTDRNTGGLFGGAAVINPGAGSMFSYDAKAIQGFDKSDYGMHWVPGTIHPSLNDGDQDDAWVFFGVPQNASVMLDYGFSVDAVSAVFMHEFVMNEYTTADVPAEAATEWVVTFPTKNFYVDPTNYKPVKDSYWRPSLSEGLTGVPIGSCNLWEPGQPYPTIDDDTGLEIDGPGPWTGNGEVWNECVYVEVEYVVDPTAARPPFTEQYGAEDCEVVALVTYDRDERTYVETIGGKPPVVSPAPPSTPGEDVVFELCNEVNILRFGDRSVFGSLADVDGDSLVLSVQDEFTDGWGWIDFGFDPAHVDANGLVGLPVTGFAAYQFENAFVESDEGTVKAFYGGLFGHKGNVRKVAPPAVSD